LEQIYRELDWGYRNGEISRQIYDSATGGDGSGGNRGNLGESERSGARSDAKAELRSQVGTDGIFTTPGRTGVGREKPPGQIEKLSPQARDASLQIATQQIPESKDWGIDVSVNTSENKSEWIEKFKKLSCRELEKEVSKVSTCKPRLYFPKNANPIGL